MARPPMSLEEAQEILDAESGRVLGNITRRAVETIAGMKTEWGVTAQFGAQRLVMSTSAYGNAFPARGRWFPTKSAAETFMGTVTAQNPRIVHRHVAEVIDSE